MRTLKLTLQYDGTAYVGWQRQPNGPSIQAVLEEAIARIDGAPVAVHGAGRTDAGVHALAQVASVRAANALDEATLRRALNAVLPRDVRVIGVERAGPEFHARFSARAKTYEYRIVDAPFISPFLRHYAWHVPQPLDVAAMRTAAESLVGRHDFAAYQGSGSAVVSTERTVSAMAVEAGAGFDHPLFVRVTADGFLRHMVRNIVGTLVEVGAGRLDAARPRAVLESRDRTQAGPTAPPHGLFLAAVAY